MTDDLQKRIAVLAQKYKELDLHEQEQFNAEFAKVLKEEIDKEYLRLVEDRTRDEND